MTKTIKKFKVDGVPSNLEHMPFGRQIEFFRIIETFKQQAKSIFVDMKRRTPAKAIAEFKKLYEPKQFFCSYHDEPNYRDDSFQMWYTT